VAKSGTLTVKVLGNTRDFDQKMSGLGKAAGAAFAAVGAAAVVGAAKSLTAFTDFQSSMNEVFTLLPGISQGAMDEMSGQVKDFSREFGVLPDEVVPALYQSLSAGVPKDNVFEFLETAQQAAKGGVTDLTTAVDGISSVVNAYGDDVIDATQASDLMFTAVRLGKTNFEELSASLSNVTPIASGLGVKFEDVSAGLAAMTAKGTPTAQATTQLRALFVELSKAGGTTAGIFEDMAGKSFQEFIAAGGNTSDALDIMQEAAAESGVQIQDLFGSVEAGSAALSLAGDSTFSDNIGEMGNAAGATQAAFDQMMTGLGPIFDRVKAGIQVFLIDVGERLAPVVEQAMDTASRAFSQLSDWWDVNGPTIMGHIATVRDAIQEFADRARPVIERVVGFLRDNAGPVFAALAVVVGTVLVAAVWSLVGALAALFSPVVLIVGGIALLVGAVVYAYQNFETFRNIIDGVVGFLVGTVWPRIKQFADFVIDKFRDLVGWVEDHWGAIQEAISHVVNVVSGIIRTVIDVVSALWRAWGDDLLAMVRTVWGFISTTVENAINFVRSIVETVLALINGDWREAWEGIKGALSAVWDQIVNVVSTAVGLVGSVIGGVLSTISEVWSGIWDQIGDTVSGVWDWIVDKVRVKIQEVKDEFNQIVGFITGLPARITSAASGMWDGIKTAFRSVINWIVDKWNSLSFSLPSVRVPGLGTVGGGTLSTPNIPRVAQGGLFAANRPTLAIVGDNVTQQEIVSPEDLLRQVVREESGRGGSGDTYITVNVPNYVGDKGDLLRVVKAELAKDSRRGGTLVASVRSQ